MSFKINIGPNIRKSPYFEATVQDGVKTFSVYNHMFIPGNFGDPAGEYRRLTEGVAMWDVAAQRQVQFSGPDAGKLAQYLTTRDISNTHIGQGRYVVLCNHEGHVINDPVLLKLAEDRYWLSIADSDIALWAEAVARERNMDVRVFEPDVSPLAVQGPMAVNVVESLFGPWIREINYFGFQETSLNDIPLVLARSGWSKQGGFELYLLDGTRGTELWDTVKAAGVPYDIGPGAPNDVERLESGLLSYGADFRVQTHPVNPYEIGLGKLVNLDSEDDFIGREALRNISKCGITRHLTGLILVGPPVEGNQNPLDITWNNRFVGTASEIAHSHRFGKNIGMAMVAVEVPEDAQLMVHLQNTQIPAQMAKLPFIKASSGS